MKKFFAILFVLLFSFSCALADVEVVFSTFSDDDLIRLYSELCSQFSERGLIFRKKFSEGVYSIGSDIPEGLYYVYPSFSATITINKPDNSPAFRMKSYTLFPHSEPFLFELYSGSHLILEDGEITLVSCIDGYTRSWLDMTPSGIQKFTAH